MTQSMSDIRPRGRSDVVFRQLDEEWVLFDPCTTQLHALNITAALIWAHCDGQYTTEGIAEAVAAAFDPPIAQPQALDDVGTTLKRFWEAGLLEGP